MWYFSQLRSLKIPQTCHKIWGFIKKFPVNLNLVPSRNCFASCIIWGEHLSISNVKLCWNLDSKSTVSFESLSAVWIIEALQTGACTHHVYTLSHLNYRHIKNWSVQVRFLPAINGQIQNGGTSRMKTVRQLFLDFGVRRRRWGDLCTT